MLDPGLQSDLERPGDADDRPVRQHRDQRLDPPPRRRGDQRADGSRSGSRTSASSARSPCCRRRTRSRRRWKGFRLGILDAARRRRVDDARGHGAAPRRRVLEEDLRLPRQGPEPPAHRAALPAERPLGRQDRLDVGRAQRLRASCARRRAGSCSSSSPTAARPRASVRTTRPCSRSRTSSKAIVDGWSADLPDIVEKPE